MYGDNLMVWDGKEHIPTPYYLFKHLCLLRGVTPRTNLYNKKVRYKEVLEMLG
jgi:hypothetical protein